MNPLRLTLLLTLPLLSYAQEHPQQNYLCKQGEHSRQLSLNYLEPPSALPCEVRYSKNSSPEVLWRADKEKGYCEKQLAAFIKKQESWGWDCKKIEKTRQND
ncbi:hypothetical protein [Agaribacterium sp. ZY112]|uniref:hypothetical protein n=1 Tax=Agaribacterium sp. ZY112 TaxID=3233574 RepID=UPI00352666E1